MEQETLKIAHVTREVLLLPFLIDKDRLLLIERSLKENLPLEIEDRFYFDTIANDIAAISERNGGTTDAAFLMLQLPFLPMSMVSHYIECVCRDENPLGAYFAVQLNGAINSDDRNDELIGIIINKGDIALWIESVRNIPSMPIETIIRQVSLAETDQMDLWNKEVGEQAREMYNNFCESLMKPIDIDNSDDIDDSTSDDKANTGRFGSIKNKFGSSVNAVKGLKKS